MSARRLLSFLAVATVALAAGAGLARSHDEPSAAASPTSKQARSLRVQVLAHVNPGGGYTADVYGHRGHAYLSSWHGPRCPAIGVRVLDVRNPARPRHVATFGDRASDPAVQHTWTEKTIVKHVRSRAFTGELAVTSFQACRGHPEAFRGFGLYDVTDPARPRKLALVRTDPRGSHEIWLQPRGRRAYVYTAIPVSELVSAPGYDPRTQTADAPGKADFRIFDVSDPAHPVQVGEWGAWRELGVRPFQGRDGPLNLVHSVITNAAATRAYLSYWDLGTVILDISRPERPRYLGRTRPPQRAVHSAALARRGRILIETHETSGGRPALYDISNPRRPRLLSQFRLASVRGGGLGGSVHDPKVRGNRAYFSWYSGGVAVADISRPRRPRLIANFVPRPTADTGDAELCGRLPRCTMTWGVYVERRYVLASDMVSGLWIFRIR